MASVDQFFGGQLAPIRARFQSADSAALLLIALCWMSAVILVNPLGEFPSVDDWSYVSTVRALVERGEIELSDWIATNFISQAFWGALFAMPFGVSYTTLRISTIVAALLAAIALYRIIRNVDWPIPVALLAALSLLFNPIFFTLSFSFMSDVPFVAAQTGAMLFLLGGLRSGSRASSALGWVLALLAQLCRQTGLVIPLAYGGAYIVKQGWGLRRLAMAVLPLLVFLGVQWTYQYWLTATGRTPLMFGLSMRSILPKLAGSPVTVAENLFEVARYAFFYLGLFLLPISLPIIASIINSLSHKRAVTSTLVLAGTTVALAVISLRAGLIMPIWPHTWRSWGIAADSYGVTAPPIFLEFVTVISVCGGVFLLTCIGHAAYHLLRERPRAVGAWEFVFGLLGAAALLGILSLIDQKFDRYLLPAIPWIALSAMFAVPEKRNFAPPLWALVASGVLVAGMAWYSIVNEHNYMAEKRVWAAAINELVAQGIPRETIDATWIFNGEVSYGRFGTKTGASPDWYRSRDYVVGIWPEPNYTLLHRYPVPRWPIWGSTGSAVLVYGPKAEPR